MASGTSKVVTFARAFELSAVKYRLPAGAYTIETTAGVRRPGDRPFGTYIRLPLVPGAAGAASAIMIDPIELEAALARDRAPESYGPEPAAYGPETVGDRAAREARRS